MLVTLKFLENDVLYCIDPLEVGFKIEDDKLAIYQEDKFLGYFASVVGIDEADFLKIAEDKLKQ